MADEVPAKRKRTEDHQILKCLAFSDDLSGATDSGGEFLQAGLDTQALLYSEASAPFDTAEDCDVLIVDTDSRSVDVPHALRHLRSANRRLENLEALVYYKKIDSTVRGNLSAEVDCLMKERSFDMCFLAPALPQAGRITIGGYHLLDGVPITNTDIGHSISSCSLLTLLSDMKSANIVHIDLNTVIQGSEAICKMAVGHLSSGQQTVFVCDASSQQHLQCVVQAAKFTSEKLDRTMLLCGSSGIAKEIPDVFRLHPRKNHKVSADWSMSSGEGVLIVCGSQHDMTSQQVKQLMQEVPVQELVVRPGKKIDDEVLSEGHVLIRMEDSVTVDRSAVEFLCTAAVQLLSKRRFQGLVLTGGCTAFSLLTAMKVQSLLLLERLEPNTTLCQLVGGPFSGMGVVIKPGALGSQGVFIAAVRRFCQLAGEESKPILAVTMGDPCGIGPEIIAKGLNCSDVQDGCRPLVIGDAETLREAVRCTGSEVDVVEVGSVREGESTWPGTIDWELKNGKVRAFVWNPIRCDRSRFSLGQVSAEAGRCAAEWAIHAVRLTMAGRTEAIVTAPLNKEAMNMGGYTFAGHTELLAKYSGAKSSRLMLVSDKLRVVHATGHCALRQVPEKLTVDRIVETVRLAHEFLSSPQKPQPRIALAGLNPHAGDGGLFGDEETTVIEPALQLCRHRGWNVFGPIPSDTLFGRAVKGEFDIVVAMYHDQGHIPAKLLGFGDTVNVTLGLPIIRTSVDHGTAFDIAGKGLADHQNILQAMRLAVQLARK